MKKVLRILHRVLIVVLVVATVGTGGLWLATFHTSALPLLCSSYTTNGPLQFLGAAPTLTPRARARLDAVWAISSHYVDTDPLPPKRAVGLLVRRPGELVIAYSQLVADVPREELRRQDHTFHLRLYGERGWVEGFRETQVKWSWASVRFAMQTGWVCYALRPHMDSPKWSEVREYIVGFRMDVGVDGWPLRPFPKFMYREVYLRCSLALLMLAFALYPIVLLAYRLSPWWRRRQRRRRNLCLHCGYDLTGNVTGICPECGRGIT